MVVVHNRRNPFHLGEVRAMSKVINCECGETIRAEDQDGLIELVETHIKRDHPELVGKLSREDIVAMAEEA
jgi:hypothetical protein